MGNFIVSGLTWLHQSVRLELRSTTLRLRLTLEARVHDIDTFSSAWSAVAYTLWPTTSCCDAAVPRVTRHLSAIHRCPSCLELLDFTAHAALALSHGRNVQRDVVAAWMADRTGVLETELYVDAALAELTLHVQRLRAYVSSVRDNIAFLNSVAANVASLPNLDYARHHFQPYRRCLRLDPPANVFDVEHGPQVVPLNGSTSGARLLDPFHFTALDRGRNVFSLPKPAQHRLSYDVCGYPLKA